MKSLLFVANLTQSPRFHASLFVLPLQLYPDSSCHSSLEFNYNLVRSYTCYYTGYIKKWVIDFWSALARSIFNLQKTEIILSQSDDLGLVVS